MRSLGGVIAGLLVIGAIIGMKLANRSSYGDDVLKSAQQMMSEMPNYEKNKDYINWLVEDAHSVVFEKNYDVGYGRRSRSTFHADRYFDDLFDHMINKAKEDGSPHIGVDIQKFLEDAYLPEPD